MSSTATSMSSPGEVEAVLGGHTPQVPAHLVGGDDARGAALLGGERKEAVVGADVEDGLARQVGRHVDALELSRAIVDARRDDAVPQVDSVEPFAREHLGPDRLHVHGACLLHASGHCFQGRGGWGDAASAIVARDDALRQEFLQGGQAIVPDLKTLRAQVACPSM